MKNTIKFLGVIALVAVIVFSAVACGGGGNSGGGRAARALQEAVAAMQAAVDNNSREELNAAEPALIEAIKNINAEIFVETFKNANIHIQRSAIRNGTPEMVNALAATVVTPVGDFRYELTNDRRGIRITLYTGNSLIVNIPATIEDMQVLEIGVDAFQGNWDNSLNNRDHILYITIPYGVEVIGEGAFQSQKGITNLVIPDSVREIGRNAFFGQSGITSLVIPDSVQVIGSSAFSSMTNLTTVTLPDGLRVIPGRAFLNSRNLTTVNLPTSLVEIGGMAFSGCAELTDLIIPDSLTSVRFSLDIANSRNEAFQGCQKLPIRTRERLQELGYTGNF
jgi:hypothetical protein